jgi:hypothetical protein
VVLKHWMKERNGAIEKILWPHIYSNLPGPLIVSLD